MKIKDINQYRTYYKKEIRKLSDDRNENHMGSYIENNETGEKTFYSLGNIRIANIR